MRSVYISIGSNINPRPNVLKALRLLSQLQTVTKISTVYRTRPELNRKQPDFYNCVIAIKTSLSPIQIKNKLRKIEQQLGRKRTNDKFASRTIDLDLITYGNKKIKSLNLPDPQIFQRPYLAAGLKELNPGLVPNHFKTKTESSFESLAGIYENLRKGLKL